MASEQRKADEAKKKAETAAEDALVGDKRKLEQGGVDGRTGPRQRIGEVNVDEAKMLRRRQVIASQSYIIACCLIFKIILRFWLLLVGT